MSGAVTIPAPVAALLKQALAHAAAKRPGLGVESLAAASIVDIQQFQQKFLATATTAGVLADLYAQVAGVGPAPALPERAAPGRPVRVAYVLFQIAPGQAASRRVLNLLRHHDRGVVEPVVMVTEDLCRRSPATTVLSLPDDPSTVTGAAILSAMRETGAAVEIIEPAGTQLEAGERAARRLRDLGVDVAVYLGSPATAVQAVCAMRRGAAVQVNLNIGVPLLVPGIDAVVYTNPRRRESDTPEVARRGVRVLGVECSGCDALAASRARPVSRAELGVPEGAVLAVTASNKLGVRVSDGSFATDLARFLMENPGVWWAGIGKAEPMSAWTPLREAGVMGRVVLTGPLADIKPVLRCADLYLNEYPEGGYNTVVEAMAAGCATVAWDSGDRHCESAGVQMVGGTGGAAGTLAEYWLLASRWARDAGARRAVVEAQRERAITRFDYTAVCRQYERFWTELAGGAG